MILVAISVASENSFSTFTTPSDSPDLLPYDDPNSIHVMKMYLTVRGRFHKGYCCRKHDKKYATKGLGSIYLHDLIITKCFNIVMGFPG